MTDDIKLSGYIDDYYAWKALNKGKIRRPYWKVFEDDGDVKTEEDDGSESPISGGTNKWREDKNGKYRYCTIVHYTTSQTFKINVKETLKEYYSTGERTVTYFATIDGSLKKNHFGGTNAGSFLFPDQLQQISIIESLHFDLSKLKIDNIAPSVCIELPFPVMDFLNDSLISYRGEPFKPYDPDNDGKVIGYYCAKHQLDIKIYDKSLQLNLSENFMQFEDSFKKMKRLKEFGIKYLSDLKDHAKVYKLKEILLNTWDDILLFDDTIKSNDVRLNVRQKDMVEHGYSDKYWKRMKDTTSNSTYWNRVNEFKTLSEKFGSNYHNMIRDLIINEWEELSKSWTILPGVKMGKLDNITSTVRGNIVQVYKESISEPDSSKIQIASKIKINMVNKAGSKKSNKQVSTEKREQKKLIYNSFLSKLKVTLDSVEDGKMRVKGYKAAA